MPAEYQESQLLCLYEDIEDILSQNGLSNMLDDLQNGEPEDVRKSNLRQRATTRVRFYVSRRYEDAVLLSNVWLRWQAAHVGAYYACTRKGGGVPPGIQRLYDEAIENLMAIQNGAQTLPDGAGERIAGIPVMTNTTVDQRYVNAKIRAIREISTPVGNVDIPSQADSTPFIT